MKFLILAALCLIAGGLLALDRQPKVEISLDGIQRDGTLEERRSAITRTQKLTEFHRLSEKRRKEWALIPMRRSTTVDATWYRSFPSSIDSR